VAGGFYERAVKANGRHARSWYYLAQHNQRFLKDAVRAEECFKKALDCNPRLVNCVKDYANFLRAQKRMDDAEVRGTTPLARLCFLICGVRPGCLAARAPGCAVLTLHPLVPGVVPPCPLH
jgi:hypothetical protein